MSRRIPLERLARRRLLCIFVFLTAFLPPLHLNALSFDPRLTLTAGKSPLGVGIADLDGDGNQDILAVALDDDRLLVFRNEGRPDGLSFAPRIHFSTGVHPEGLAVADLDGDGKLDVAIANAGGGGSVSIYRNASRRGSISLVDRLDIPLNTAHRVAAADFNGDGRIDLAVTSNSAQQIAIFENFSAQGYLSFTHVLSLNTASYSNSIAAGDIDGDGRPDILAPIQDTDSLYIFRNVSSADSIRFYSPAQLSAGDAPNGISIGDLNGDAKIDVIVSNPYSDSVSLFLNQSSIGAFSLTRNVFSASDMPADVALGDFDRDGRLDVIASSDTGDLAVLRNRATSSGVSLDLSSAPESGPGTFLPTVGDIDGDGYLDIAVSNHRGSTVTVLRSSGNSPSEPSNAIGDQIMTTDRLNLRSCPGKDCSVIRTLPQGTRLTVFGRQADWLRVRLLETQETGWVHAGYTKVVEQSPSRGSFLSIFERRDVLIKLLVIISLLGALVTMASFGRHLRPNTSQGHLFVLTALSVFTGAVMLLNQFGPVLADLAAPRWSLEGVSFLWKVNSLAEGSLSYRQVVLILAATVAGVAAASPGAGGGKISFFQGVLTGFLALPAFTILTMLSALLFYLLSFVFKALGYILGLIAIPFAWLFQHLLMPVLRLLAIPFIWLWDNFLREIILFLAIPFAWAWRVILQPLTGVLFKFILMPILFIVTGVAAALVCLFPFGVIGVVALESVRNSFSGGLDSHGLFAQGVTAGFLLLDATVLTTLNFLGFLHTAPPLSFAIPVALQLVVFLRLLAPSDRQTPAQANPMFQQKLAAYWESSQLELIATCVMIPLGILAAIASDDN